MGLSTNKNYLPPGFTLVEVMVSMLIALIVMGGVYRTLLDETVEHERSELILDMQNNARMAMTRLTRDVRRAGFLGCGGAAPVVNPLVAPTFNILTNSGPDATLIGKLTVARLPVLAGDPPGLVRNMADYGTILRQLIDADTYANPVTNVDYLGEALGFADNAPGDHAFYQEGTDALTLVYLSDEQQLTAAMANVGAGIPVPNSSGYEDGDILYLTDCVNYSLFQKTGHTSSPDTVLHAVSGLNNNANFQQIYGQLARLFKLNTSTYFIEKDNFTLAHNETNDDRAVASNIEDLQVEFLFDELDDDDLTNDVWVTSLGAHTSKEVRAMRIWLLAMSDPDFGYSDNNTYDYPNSPYYTPDPNTTYKDAAGNLKPANPFTSVNGAGGSPASQAPINLPANGEHRHRFLASEVIYLRNAGLK